MTLDPNLDWLANDEGDLQPEAVRAMAEQGQRLAAGQPVAPAIGEPRDVRPEAQQRPVVPARGGRQPQPPAGVTPVQRAAAVRRPSNTPLIAVLLVTALGAGVVGALVANRFGSIGSVGFGAPQLQPATAEAIPMATINGINVNLRTGPGLGFPVIARLSPGEGVMLREERDGWFATTTMSGVGGWVFGAFLRGSRLPDRGAAVITQRLGGGGYGPFVVLSPGDKVFCVRHDAGRVELVLPTGRRLRVAPEALVRVD